MKGKEGAYGQQPTLGPYAPATWSGAAALKQRPSISPPKTVVGKALFAQALEQKYRVATYEGIPVYGAVKVCVCVCVCVCVYEGIPVFGAVKVWCPSFLLYEYKSTKTD